MDAFNFLNNQAQSPVMPESNDELIDLLGLATNNAGNNTSSKAMDDLVKELDLKIFASPTTVVATAAAPMGYVRVQGQQQQVAPYQQLETIAYVDFDSSQADNNQYQLSGGYMVSNEVNGQQPTSVLKASTSASPIPTVAGQDTRQAAGGKSQGRKREPKVKLYQKEPLACPAAEKKRLNALNSKINRDKKKTEMQEKENLVKSLTTERDVLQTENTQLMNRCQLLESHLKAVCKQFNVPVVILPQ